MRNINQKKKSDILQQSIDIHYLTNAAGERISLITLWNIVNWLSKHDFACVGGKQLERQEFFFSSNDQKSF